MEDFEQKTDSMEEEKTTSSEISCAEETTENCIEMTESYDEEHAQEKCDPAPEVQKQSEEKFDSKAKKIFVPLLSFFVPVLLFGLAWANNGITYGGNVTPLIYDMNAQYMPFIASLRYILSGDFSILFNWNCSLGGNYLALFAYYLASPLNWITVFWDLDQMPNAIYVLTLLKIGLCGLNFSTYLRYSKSQKKVKWVHILFSSCYALMSYNVMYSMCLMWMDGLIMLPLILLGVDNILEGKKGHVYFASIAALFFCNFYISYMVGIFVALYFICGAIVRYEKGKVKHFILCAAKFAVETLLALGINMPLILPTLKSFSTGVHMALADEQANPLAYQFGILDLLKKLLPQQYDSLEYAGLPSVFCGSVMLILFAVFFLQKRTVREKLTALILPLFVALGFIFPSVDYAMHGFQYPHSYPYRYAFLFSTAILITAYMTYERMQEKSNHAMMLVGVLGAYSFLELFMNSSVIFSGLHEENQYLVKETFDQYYTTMKPLIDVIQNDSKRNTFYRVGTNEGFGGSNFGLFFGVSGTDSFVSTFNSFAHVFMRRMGADTTERVLSSSSLTPFLNSLLGVEYILTTSEMEPSYELVASAPWNEISRYLYRNPYALSLGILMPELSDKKGDNYCNNEDENAFEMQNIVARMFGYDGNLFEKIPISISYDNEMKIEFDFSDASDSLAYLQFCNVVSLTGMEIKDKDILIEMDGIKEREIKFGLSGHTVIPITLSENDDHIITISNSKDIDLSNTVLYSCNIDAYEKFMHLLSERQVELINVSANEIIGKIYLDEKRICFTSLPYDEGYCIKIDGTEVTRGIAMSAFICFEIPEGLHEIQITYVPSGLIQGIKIASLSIMICLLVVFYQKRRHIL
ncbi:MAG: YfhO family protein [Acetatifactor sp.]